MTETTVEEYRPHGGVAQVEDKEPLVWPRLDEALRKPRPHYSHSGYKRLWASGIGYCPRKTMLRHWEVEAVDPIEKSITLIDCGNLGTHVENATFEALERIWKRRIEQGVYLRNEVWSGKVDFLIHRKPLIVIEHKAKGNHYFDYNAKLPQPEHCAQVWLYAALLKEDRGLDYWPRMVVFYRAWANTRAEFTLEVKDDGLLAHGLVTAYQDGEDEVERFVPIRPWERRALLEEHYQDESVPEPPAPRPSDDLGCTFNGEISCEYYRNCWS